MRGIIAVGAALFIAGSANAQTTPQECAAMGDSLQRLTCFDKLFPKTEDSVQADSGKETVDIVPSAWDIEEEKSPIDDSMRLYAILMPREASSSSVFRGPTLFFRCRDNKTNVLIMSDKYLIGSNQKITYRINSDKPITAQWALSDSHKAIGLWSGSQAIPFMKSLKNGDTLAIRIESENSEAIFDLGDVETVVSKISDACNWK